MSSVSAVPDRSQAPTKGRRRFTVDALFTDHRPQAVGVEDLPTAKEIRLERIEADPEQPGVKASCSQLRCATTLNATSTW